MTTQEKNWLTEPKVYKKCPKCQHYELDTRIPRGLFVKHFLFWKPYKRYRCSRCAAKVYVLE